MKAIILFALCIGLFTCHTQPKPGTVMHHYCHHDTIWYWTEKQSIAFLQTPTNLKLINAKHP